ncbi:MAG TPA: hypothetical protein VMU77_02080, partial [Acidimicrobiales bacterium]|nr:hypothetical protein [Acidimicrobiales bacterium]
MIRFAWLQFRTQALIALGALGIVGIALAITGGHLVHIYDTQVSTCGVHGNCIDARNSFLQIDASLQKWLNVLVMAVPGIIGIFWGAPMVAREMEAGTFRLAWTQTVSRARWVGAKLGLVVLFAIFVSGLLSFMVTWWSSPLDHVRADQFGAFDVRDIVPIGYGAFAFVLGVAAGVLIRRTLPAMASTLVGFVFVRLAFVNWVRPHLVSPATKSVSLNTIDNGWGYISTVSGNVASQANLVPPAPNITNAWVYSTSIVDRSGHLLSPQDVKNACPALGMGPPGGGPPQLGGSGSILGHSSRVQAAPPGAVSNLHDCIAKVSTTFHEVITYQPAVRFWDFQWIELAIYLAAAGALAGL